MSERQSALAVSETPTSHPQTRSDNMSVQTVARPRAPDRSTRRHVPHPHIPASSRQAPAGTVVVVAPTTAALLAPAPGRRRAFPTWCPAPAAPDAGTTAYLLAPPQILPAAPSVSR